MGLTVDIFINFESPRVLNPAGANYFMATVHNPLRVTHWDDVVPHIPAVFLGPFKHIGTEVYYYYHY